MFLSPEEVEARLREAATRAREIDAVTKPTPAPMDERILKPDLAVVAAAVETDEQREAREQKRIDAHIARLLNAACVPARYANASISELDHLPETVRPAYAKAVDLLRQRAVGGAVVGLCGARGPGKTHMACGLVLEHCRNLRSARYCTAMDIFLAIKREYAKRDGYELNAERQFLEPSLLVIDEIQVRGETPWEDVRLTSLIDKRYGALKSTVIITNLTKAKLKESVGDSVSDRFHDFGGVIECAWPSLRGRIEQVAP